MMLARLQALPEERILGVETGGAAPHTAIREDASINLQAIAQLKRTLSRPRHRLHRIGRRQSGRHLLAGPGRPDPLRHLGLPGRGHSAQGRAGASTRSDFLIINKARPGAARECRSRCDGDRRSAHARRQALRLHRPVAGQGCRGDCPVHRRTWWNGRRAEDGRSRDGLRQGRPDPDGPGKTGDRPSPLPVGDRAAGA